MKYRIIMQTSENGDFEAVCFTEDFDTPLDDFKFPQSAEIKEVVANCDLPSKFPLGYNLIRE
jgi:hypothetical protein